MSGLEEASAIIGVVAFVVDIAGKTWNFLSKMKSAPTEAFDIAQDLYLVSSICVKISLILDEKDEMFQFAYKTLQKLCLEIDNLNLVGQKELEKIISKDTEGDTRIEKNSKSTRTSVTKRYIWAWNDEQRKYLLGRVESAKSCFLMLLKQNEFKYFKELSDELKSIHKKLDAQAQKDQVQHDNLIKCWAAVDSQLSDILAAIVHLSNIIKETPTRPAETSESLTHAPPPISKAYPVPSDVIELDLDQAFEGLVKGIEQQTKALTGISWDTLQETYTPPSPARKHLRPGLESLSDDLISQISKEDGDEPVRGHRYSQIPWHIAPSNPLLAPWKGPASLGLSRFHISESLLPTNIRTDRLHELLGKPTKFWPSSYPYGQWMNNGLNGVSALHGLSEDEIIRRIK